MADWWLRERWTIQTYIHFFFSERSFVSDAQDCYVLVSLIRIIKNLIPPWSYNLVNLIRRYVYNKEMRRQIHYHTNTTPCIHFVCYHFHPRGGVVRSIDMQISDRRRHYNLYDMMEKKRAEKLEEGIYSWLENSSWKFIFQVHILFASTHILLERAPRGFPDGNHHHKTIRSCSLASVWNMCFLHSYRSSLF